jgi:hypothetical protein
MAIRDYLDTLGLYRLWSDIKPKIDAKFGKIKVGVTELTPTSSDDSVTLVSGNNVVITPVTSTNSIEISANITSKNLYVLKGEHVYTSTSGGETTFDLSLYSETKYYNAETDVLLVSVDGLTLNDELYNIVGTTVTLNTQLYSGSSISFKVLTFGVKGDIETLTLAYDRFLSYFQSHQPRYEDNYIVFPEVSYLDFQVNLPARSPVYAYAQKFNNLLVYLQNNQPHYDTNTQQIVFPAIDIDPFRFYANS